MSVGRASTFGICRANSSSSGTASKCFPASRTPSWIPGVNLTKVPSLDLYAEPEPFRNPRPSEFRDRIDVEEWARMRTGAFPEPLTFARRVIKLLRARADEFDIVHDNQTLATPLLEIEKFGLPLMTTLHHPISFDRRIDLASTQAPEEEVREAALVLVRQDAGQGGSAAAGIITPSESSRRDVATEFGVDLDRMKSIVLGVDHKFVPPTEPRVPGRIIAMASADAPMKGISTLLRHLRSCAPSATSSSSWSRSRSVAVAPKS